MEQTVLVRAGSVKRFSLGQNPRFYLGSLYNQWMFKAMEQKQLKNLPLNEYIETEPIVRTVRPLNHQQQIGQIDFHSGVGELYLMVDRTSSSVRDEKYVNSQKLEAYRNHWKLEDNYFVGREGT